MGIPLYRIAAEYRAMIQTLEEADLSDEAIRDTLEAESGDLIDKLSATVAALLNIEAEADAVAAAKERMAAREKALRGRAAWLRSYVVDTMRACGVPEVNTPEFVAKVQKGGESLVLASDQTFIDLYRATRPDFVREVPASVAINKDAVKAALKAGEAIEGCEIRTSYRLAIK